MLVTDKQIIPNEQKINKYLDQPHVPPGTLAIEYDAQIYRMFTQRNIPVKRRHGFIILPPHVAEWWTGQFR